MPIVTVPRPLREKLGDEGADALVSLINEANGQVRTDVIVFVEEKFERRLAEEIAKVNQRITEQGARLEDKFAQQIASLQSEMGKQVARGRTEIAEQGAVLRREMAEQGAAFGSELAKLRVDIAESKADITLWMFIFCVGQIGVIMGILFVFFR